MRYYTNYSIAHSSSLTHWSFSLVSSPTIRFLRGLLIENLASQRSGHQRFLSQPSAVRLGERPDVRAIRVELKPMANRAIHQHDDVKFHLFIPLTGKLQVTIGSDKPVDAPVGQAFYIKGGTPHGFRDLGFTPGSAI